MALSFRVRTPEARFEQNAATVHTIGHHEGGRALIWLLRSTQRLVGRATGCSDDGQFAQARYRPQDMETESAVMDLTVACVTSVKNATGLELDLTQDTLPVLDHYADLADSPRDEVVSLLAPMCGAYFGEVIRRELADGDWQIGAEGHAQWRLSFDHCSLAFNPIGAALEILLRQDVPEWGAHLQTAPADRLRIEKALDVFGDVRDRDYYTFSVRYEAIEQAYRTLLNNPASMHPKG